MQPPINQLYKFGQFCLDVSKRVLRCDGRNAGTDDGILRQLEAGTGEALRRAPLEMPKGMNRRHPYYWESFIQSGEWADLEGKR
jgi:hypothetical protein